MRSLVIVAVVCGCAASSPHATCGSGWSSLSRVHGAPRRGLHEREPVLIENVRVAGVDARLAGLLRMQLATRPGLVLDAAPLAEDLRLLWGFGVIDDARVEVAGGDVTFVVAPRPPITHVVHRGGDALAQRRFRELEAAAFEPARIHRMTEALRESYVREGRLDATVEARQRAHATGVEVCVATNPGPKVTIARFELVGGTAVPQEQLVAALRGKLARVNRVGGPFDEAALAYDELVLLGELYERGHIEARVGKPSVKRRGNRLDVAIPIDEGPRYRLGEIAAPVPVALRRGDVFVRSQVQQALEVIRAAAGDAWVTPLTTVDKAARRIDIRFEIEWRWPWDALRFWLLQAR